MANLRPEALIYSCFDFRLRSEMLLPELTEVDDPRDARPIVEVRLGKVRETLLGGGEAMAGLQVSGDTALLAVTGIARYLVRGGNEIIVDPLAGGSDRMVRLFLLGSTLGILCHQRGLLPLHANAIIAGGGAHAFAGPSGAGKSTLAAYFAQLGHEVLCDDVCVIGFDRSGSPITWPGLPRLKLWGEASAAFGHDSRVLERVIDGQDKYHVPLTATAKMRPVTFRRLYLLERTGPDEPGVITRLRGQQSMEAVMAQTYRGLYFGPMGLTAQNFLQCAELVSRIEVYSAARTWGYNVFDREADRLAQHMLEEQS